jgi:plastocyanin
MEAKTIETTEKQPRRTRRPLTALEKLGFTCLLIAGILSAPFIFFSPPSAVSVLALLVSAGLIQTRLRWAPVVGLLVSGSNLYYLLFVNGYPVEHLTRPRDTQLQPAAAQFPIFIAVVVLLTILIIAFGSTLGATLQNYLQRQPQRPRWLTPALSGLIGLALGAILIAGIAQPPTSTASASSGEPTVHLVASNFSPTSIIVPQGSTLHLVADTAILHILSNGTWANNSPKPLQEPGAPLVNNVQISGGSLEIGPFTTAGTYHIFCTVHLNMVLTVFVP